VKVVLDTNVIVSGIFWRGTPYHILELWIHDDIQVLATESILNEYNRVIKSIDTQGKVSKSWLTFIAENATIVSDQEILKICRDPHDDKFINCAVTGKADYLVSGDDDILSLKSFPNIKIISPSEFYNLF
jgi:uncharacterized protein